MLLAIAGSSTEQRFHYVAGGSSMKVLLKTFAIIAFLALASQTVRHAYMLWFESRGSVLDKYDQPVKEQITEATSLDQLLGRYDAMHKQVESAKQERAQKGEDVSTLEYSNDEPFKSEKKLRDAITQWEETAKEIHEMRFYCLIGFFLLVGGSITYRRLNRWFGITLMIAGFSEFIYWTSPTFLDQTREFDRLLANKLALSAIALVLLIAGILYLRVFAERDESSR
jgi:hypothetical protein